MRGEQDVCMVCGARVQSATWGGRCFCINPKVVHVGHCGCGKPVGYIIDDDYCGPEVLVCSACLEKVGVQ